jgi:DNA-binding response OmpR family regulator
MISYCARSLSNINRILVVDDIADNLFLIQMVLEAEGYQVDVADSGKAALALIAQKPPDLMLLDVMMPGMSGYEVVRQIRENSNLPYIPIIMISGCEQTDESQGLKALTQAFIPKPIDFDKLFYEIRAISATTASEISDRASLQVAS